MVTRRTIITIPVAVAAAGLASGTAIATAFGPGPAPNGAVPRTIARDRKIVGGRLHAKLEERLTHLAVSWDGDGAMVTTKDAAGWTAWTAPDVCQGGPDGATASNRALLVAPGTTEYEVVLIGEGATGLVTELNTVDGPVMATTGEPLAAMPLPDGTTCPVTYLPRAAWGADEGLRFSGGVEVWPAEYAPTQALTVHHTAGANNDPDPAGTVRAIYHYQSVTLGWGDIGYHLFIDEQGLVYEGRWSGANPVPVFDTTVPAGTDPGLVVAGHVGGYNTGNLGVCLLGNLTNQGPTPAARATLVTVLASLARVCQIDPEVVVNYVGPTGNTRTVLGVSGHRDWAATECPGNNFYPQLPAVRSEVAELMANPPSPSPTPSPTESPSATPSPTPSPSPTSSPSPTPTPTRRRGPKHT
jgi:N-acetylmuramoyl-L-alanine amidase